MCPSSNFVRLRHLVSNNTCNMCGVFMWYALIFQHQIKINFQTGNYTKNCTVSTHCTQTPGCLNSGNHTLPFWVYINFNVCKAHGGSSHCRILMAVRMPKSQKITSSKHAQDEKQLYTETSDQNLQACMTKIIILH